MTTGSEHFGLGALWARSIMGAGHYGRGALWAQSIMGAEYYGLGAVLYCSELCSWLGAVFLGS